MRPLDQIEFAPVAEQERLTNRLLLRQIHHAAAHSLFYRRRWAGRRLPATAAAARAFLAGLPLTTRADLEEHNDEFRACAPSAIREIVTTSGTTRAPIRLFLTRHDLDNLARVEAYAFAAAGFRRGDLVQLCVTMDAQFMAGMAYYLGLQRIGCAVLRQGPAHPARQIEMIRRNGVTGLVTIPSFLYALAREWERQGLPRDACPVKRAVLVGENLRDARLRPNTLARQITRLWDVELYGSYGNSEMNGSMAECAARRGTHTHPDVVLPEIVDARGRALPAGRAGALVITTLAAEGTPLFRYRTGDLSFLVRRPCSCGRRSPRLGPILAREDQMLKVKGTKVYPAAVADALAGLPAVEQYVLVAEQDDSGADSLLILAHWSDRAGYTTRGLAELLAARLRITPRLRRATPEEIQALARPPGYRKRRLLVDRRPAP